MTKTPRGLRPHLVLAGACNSGKSSLLNALSGADIAVVSHHAGTTTDPVYKNMELLPYGPVTFVDTPGLDDAGDLGQKRISRSQAALTGADLVLYLCRPSEAGSAAELSEQMLRHLGPVGEEVGVFLIFTHMDQAQEREKAHSLQGGLQSSLQSGLQSNLQSGLQIFCVSNTSNEGIDGLKDALVARLSAKKHEERALLEHILRPAKLVLLIVPIDLEAPAGRLILPQVQTIREILDSDAAALVVKEREIEWALSLLKRPPDLAITDSQVVQKAAAALDPSIPLTTFSMLFARQKGDLAHFVDSARRIDHLRSGDRVVIAETCSHKQLCDDIGRVKIPRWLRQYTGCDLDIQHVSGALPEDLAGARLVIHCGGCMITRRMMLSRLGLARDSNVPVTNYGVAISHVQGVLDRVVQPLIAH